jgi:hypothetical protein
MGSYQPPYFPNNQRAFPCTEIQNVVGNPMLGDTSYHFRPVPPGATKWPTALPNQWAGGDYGVEGVQNPVRPIDLSGQEKHFPTTFTYKVPYVFHGDSDDRNVIAHPNPASFRLLFTKPLRGVSSIEVQDVKFSNQVGDVVPPGRYVWLLGGLFDGNGVFVPMAPELGIYDIGHPEATQPTVAVPNPAQPVPQTEIGEHALAKICYDDTQSSQHFTRSEYRCIKYFDGIIDTLGYIELSLTDKNGVLWDFDQDGQWSFTLEIVCKQ